MATSSMLRDALINSVKKCCKLASTFDAAMKASRKQSVQPSPPLEDAPDLTPEQIKEIFGELQGDPPNK